MFNLTKTISYSQKEKYAIPIYKYKKKTNHIFINKNLTNGLSFLSQQDLVKI